MRTQGLLLGVFLFLITFFASAINFSRVNVAWQYDLSFNVKMAHRVVRSDDGVIVFLRISTDSLTQWNYEFLAQEGYESESHRILELSPDSLFSSDNAVVLKLNLDEMNENLLVIKFSKPDSFYYYDVPIKGSAHH